MSEFLKAVSKTAIVLGICNSIITFGLLCFLIFVPNALSHVLNIALIIICATVFLSTTIFIIRSLCIMAKNKKVRKENIKNIENTKNNLDERVNF